MKMKIDVTNMPKIPYNGITPKGSAGKQPRQARRRYTAMANNIKTIIAEYMKYEFAPEFSENNWGRIDELASEIADNAVSIYTKELLEYAIENDEDVQAAFREGIAQQSFDPFDENTDFRSYVAHVGAAAWYSRNYRTIHGNIEECIACAVYTDIADEGIEYITDEQREAIDRIVKNCDTTGDLSDVIEDAKFAAFGQDEAQ